MKTLRTVSCCVTGYRKKMDGKLCEDAIKVLRLKELTIIAVADGHGDSRCVFSNIGSKLAVKAACDALKLYGKQVLSNEPAEYWNNRRAEIAQTIVKYFAHLVVLDYSTRCKAKIPTDELEELKSYIREQYIKEAVTCSPNEIREIYERRQKLGNRLQEILLLYGTTIRASVLTERYIFNLALGDGDTIAVIGNTVEWLLPKEPAYECETASLCDDIGTVAEQFMFSFVNIESEFNNLKVGVVNTDVNVAMLAISTDGFRNSFISDKMFECKMNQIYGEICEKGIWRMSTPLKQLFEKLSRDSVFQDDISMVIACCVGK